MLNSRIAPAAVLAGLCWAPIAHAATASAFDVLANNQYGQPVAFQSASVLKKGDVIKVHTFNARPVMVLQVAMCDADCPRMHLVKTIPLYPYYAGTSAVATQSFVIPENGRVSFWVQQADNQFSVPIAGASGTWSFTFINRFASYAAPTPYLDTQPMAAEGTTLNDGTLRARYFHNTFITVRLADSNS
ncbi:MAG TPA: hypothetical protein VME63_02675 [Dyella sp.]|uniref:hypothetical protein n=1 Tax=Dyella sp. TaxID=1869338 RepID=UPI002B5AF795|nr:hypothetical protein [Dyella sp.]HTV84280.1 hypothetical protein [Dyella sp.]